MRVAVFSNVRTTINAQKEGYMYCFNTAFRAGSVMGFALTGLGTLVLYLTLLQFSTMFGPDRWILMMWRRAVLAIALTDDVFPHPGSP